VFSEVCTPLGSCHSVLARTVVECLLHVIESCGFPGMLGKDCMHWRTLISGMLCLELLDQTMKKPLDFSFQSI
jgi:hypothetical protein